MPNYTALPNTKQEDLNQKHQEKETGKNRHHRYTENLHKLLQTAKANKLEKPEVARFLDIHSLPNLSDDDVENTKVRLGGSNVECY